MEKYIKILKDHHIQVTQQRLEVLKTLRDLNTHVTVDQVICELKKKDITLTMATVYNILNMFDKKGIIMKINAAGEPVIYDVNVHDHAHVCNSATREVFDYDYDEVVALVKNYLAQHPIKDFSVDRVDINFIGQPAKS